MAEQQSAFAPAGPTAQQQQQTQTPAPSIGSDSAVGQASELTSGMLRIGSQGAAVEHAQSLLNQHGADLAVDGIFGPLTHGATVKFQAAGGLMADGIIGPQTWGALETGVQQTPPEQKPPEQTPPEQKPPEQKPPEQTPPPGGGPPVSPLQTEAASQLPGLLANPAVHDSPMGPVTKGLVGGAADDVVFNASAAQSPAPPTVDAARLAQSHQAIIAAIDRIIMRQDPYPGPKGAPVAMNDAQDRIKQDFLTRGKPDHDAITDAERDWLYDFMQAIGAYTLIWAWQEATQKGETLDPGRGNIVSLALGEVGKVEARNSEGDKPIPGTNTVVPWRKGAPDMERIFDKAGALVESGATGVGATPRQAIYDSNLPIGPDANNVNTGAPSWCGIFALAMHKYAGRTSANWAGNNAPWIGKGLGDGQYDVVNHKREFPKPGDVAYKADGQHHGSVIRVEPKDETNPLAGFDVVTVDGNFAFASAIVIHQEASSFWTGFFRAAPKGS